jgi:hypothetical protein
MIANHIHHALAQVKELEQRILNQQRFTGYSGKARMISGTLALGTAFVMTREFFPSTPHAHFLGWATLCVMAVLINYGALFYWFLCDPDVNRDWKRLKPALRVFPVFVVGAALSAGVLLGGQYHLLFGIWMTIFGLANVLMVDVLAKETFWVGWFYIFCGAVVLISFRTFVNPWPMGIVFFMGEWAGGILWYIDGKGDRDES